MFWLPLHADLGRWAFEIQPNRGQFSKLYIICNSSKTAEPTSAISAIVCVPTGDVTSLIVCLPTGDVTSLIVCVPTGDVTTLIVCVPTADVEI